MTMSQSRIVLIVERGPNAAEGSLFRRLIDRAGGRPVCEARLDHGDPRGDAFLRDVVEGDVDSGEGADLGDPCAHLSRANHPDLVDAHFIYP